MKMYRGFSAGQAVDNAENRVIFVGEQHDRFSHPIHPLHIIRKLNGTGLKIGVGREMFLARSSL